MEATYTQSASYELRPSTDGIRGAARAICSAVAEIVVAGVRGDDFTRAFSTAPGAEFEAVSRNSKQRHLDRGFRA